MSFYDQQMSILSTNIVQCRESLSKTEAKLKEAKALLKWWMETSALGCVEDCPTRLEDGTNCWCSVCLSVNFLKNG